LVLPEQVSGYVLLALNTKVDVIPLNNLRVIRGHTLFKVPNDPTNIGYSLYVASNYLKGSRSVGLRELQLTSFHGELLFRYFFFINRFYSDKQGLNYSDRGAGGSLKLNYICQRVKYE